MRITPDAIRKTRTDTREILLVIAQALTFLFLKTIAATIAVTMMTTVTEPIKKALAKRFEPSADCGFSGEERGSKVGAGERFEDGEGGRVEVGGGLGVGEEDGEGDGEGDRAISP